VRKASNSQRGTTFIEILAAVSIFSIVAIGLSPGLLSARKFADLSANQSIATALAGDKIEQVRTLAATAVTSGSDGPLQADGTGGGIFNRTWTVTANSPVAGVNCLSVRVSWQDRSGNNSVTLGTLFQ
jgi:type II secretory pathway pseudopilin PulG